MPPGDDIQRYLFGAWRLMTGKRDGLKLLDLSADGFWNSFYAIVLALPVMFVGWVSAANGFGDQVAELGGRMPVLFRLAFIDVAAWIAPLVVVGLLARPIGIADRFVPFVVASNWGSAIMAWMLLPVSVLDAFFPAAIDYSFILAMLLFIVIMVLAWRLTNASIDKGAGIASAVFALVFLAQVFLVIGLQDLLGLPAAVQPAG